MTTYSSVWADRSTEVTLRVLPGAVGDDDVQTADIAIEIGRSHLCIRGLDADQLERLARVLAAAAKLNIIN